MAYVTDNELGSGGQYSSSGSWRKEFVEFLRGVDLLIHDAMYTPVELESHRGWGHSTYAEAVLLAADAGAARLVLFHHEPEHDDKATRGRRGSCCFITSPSTTTRRWTTCLRQRAVRPGPRGGPSKCWAPKRACS